MVFEYLLSTEHVKQCNIQCSKYYPDKAMKLHDIHLKDPKMVTDESQELLQRYIKTAKNCIELCKQGGFN